MSNPPQIWLKYRPVRIGWVVQGRDLAQLLTAASWSTCLWGGRFNPIIPMDDIDLANNLIATFGVDILIPVATSDATKAFIANYSHLHMHLWREEIFADRQCDFADIRHAARRATAPGNVYAYAPVSSMVRPIWSQEDPLRAVFSVLAGRYPDSNEISINYPRGISGHLEMQDLPFTQDDEFPPKVAESLVPIGLTGYGVCWRGNPSSWLSPGIFFGSALDFNDLVLCWNLRAAGAEVWFYDQAHASRLGPAVNAFLTALSAKMAKTPNRSKDISLWIRTEQWTSPEQWKSDLDLTGFVQGHCPGGDSTIWNGFNIIPVRPEFSFWHHVGGRIKTSQ
jgi:hypothetical protein